MLPPSSQIDIRRQYLFQSVLPHQVNIDRDERRKGGRFTGGQSSQGQKVAQHSISLHPRTDSQKWQAHRSCTPPAISNNKPEHCGYPEPRQIGNATVPTTMPWRHNDVHLFPRHTNLPVLPIVVLPVCPMTHTKHCWILLRHHSPKPR
jgi:hypothetical protein